MSLNEAFPDEVLLHFIERLPTTVREIVLARCCKAFGRLQLVPKQDLFATFCAILRERNDEARVYTCAKMIAAVELALEDEGCRSEAAFDRELYDATGARRFSNIDLRAPLTQKLWQAARTEFLKLRSGPLSVRSLHEMLTDAFDEQSDSRRGVSDAGYEQAEPSIGSAR